MIPVNDPSLLIGLFLFAFGCEFIDSSLGMGYGTILSPILLIAGFEPWTVVPSILLSQALGGLSAANFHQKNRNVDLNHKGEDFKIATVIVLAGVVAVFMAVMISINLTKVFLKTYIGTLVIVMGLLLFMNKRFRFSWRKIILVGVLSAFNKALSGGGFGPVVTSGQMISGEKARRAIGITTAAEAPICILSFGLYVYFAGLEDLTLPLILTIGALVATPFGPIGTKRLDEAKARKMVGALCLGLGVFTLLKTYWF